eukprot:TRINITY_DN6469_c0_g1_i13.p1 TRINITY_DN6469_c0_g1~~TRINITY_DN6469_c0_g1_i13.p1  ORF type:complete len:123 (+),score=31.58 TRINITY_DN6469_c0_g1_i13:51-419(+)
MPVPSEDVPCSLTTHNFSTQIIDKTVLFQVLQMNGQVYIWIGDESASLSNLSVGIPGVQGQNGAATCIFGSSGDQSRELSEKLSSRLKKQVWVSFNTTDDILTTPGIIQALIDEIRQKPDKF